MNTLNEQADALIDVTVIFLEMNSSPNAYPHPPANVSLALLRSSKMQRHYYRYLQDRVGRKWHWVNMLRLDDEALDAYLNDPRRDIRVLYLDGSPAGFFDLLVETPDCVDLAYFGLFEHAVGHRLGRWFLGAAIEAAWSHEPKKVIVQTCTLDHPAALPLYQKLGFEPVAQTEATISPLSELERAQALFPR